MEGEVQQKNILYIGDVGNMGTALSIHALNIARLFRKLGFETTFLCDGDKSRQSFHEEYDGFEYFYTRRYIHIPKISAFEWMLDELTGWKYIREAKMMIRNQKPEIVILYGYAGEKRLIRLCKKNHIPILAERVDWFEKSDRTSAFEKYFIQRQADRALLHTDRELDGIIAISSYLKEHYEKMGQKAIQIPPIFEINQNQEIQRYAQTGELRMVYAGSLGGKKDQILPVLEALRNINAERIKIHLDIVGVDMKELQSATGRLDWDKFGVSAFGRCENAKAKNIVSHADFSLLLRENKRYAKAGFSTKFSESMSLGVPVICTKVGGADRLITDMVDGVHVENNETETICTKLMELLEKSSDEILQMKENAYHTAEKIFSIDQYTDKLRDFIIELKER